MLAWVLNLGFAGGGTPTPPSGNTGISGPGLNRGSGLGHDGLNEGSNLSKVL